MRPFAPTIRTRICVMVLVALLPALGLALYSGLQQRRLAAAAAQEDALRLARRVSRQFDRLVISARESLVELAHSSAVRGGDEAECGALMAALLEQHRQYANFGVADADGWVRCSAVPFQAPLSVADRPFVREAMEKKDFAVGEYTIGRITGEPALHFAWPLLAADGGRPQAVVVAALRVQWLEQLLAEERLPPNSSVALLDGRGRLLVQFPDPQRWSGRKVSESFLSRAIAAREPEGTAEATGVDGVRRLFAFHALGSGERNGGLYVTVGIPKSVVFAEADRILARSLSYLVLVGLLSALVAVGMAEVFCIRRVRPILRATQRLAAGDLGARTGVARAGCEIGELARAFDQMAESLQRREAEHERTVAALRDSERRFRDLFENSPDPIFVEDLQGRVLDVNRAACQLHGMEREALVGKNVLELVPADQREIVQREFGRLVAGEITQTEGFSLRNDGERVPVELRVSRIRYDGGPALLLHVRDVSARKAMAEELSTRARQQAALAQLGQRALACADVQTLMQQTVEVAAETLGVELAKVLELLPDGRRLLLRAGVGWRDGLVGRATVEAGSGSQAGYTLLSKGPVVVEELATETRFSGPALLREHGVVSGISVVIGEPARPFGVLGVHTRRRRAFTVDDVHFVQALANILAEAIRGRQTEASLRESEALFRTLSAGSPVGVFMTDPQGHCTYVNPRYRSIVGASLNDSLGEGWTRFIHEEDRERVVTEWLRFVREGGEFCAEYRIRKTDGELRHLQARAARMLSEDGALRGFVGTVEDITARKEAESALRDAEAKYRALVERLPGITYIAEAGPCGRWHYVSPQIETLLGFTPRQWTARPELWFEQLHPEDRERVLAEEARACLEGDAFAAEYRMFHRDGRVVWFRDDAQVVAAHDNGTVLLQGIMFDITERKQLEEQLRQSQKMQAVGRLAGGVAHDFNNILTAINGYSELLAKHLQPSDPCYHYVEEIAKAGARAASLTGQLLAFSRKQILQPLVLDLNSLLADMEKMLRRLIGEDIELQLSCCSKPAWVRADPGQLQQVLLNLVVNARDAMPNGGRLFIRTAVTRDATVPPHPALPAGHYVLLAVTDTGTGMTEEVRAHLFEPFFTTKAQGKGTGLGLATCYGIITQSGGAITVDTEPGKGTTFTIYLPRVLQPAASATRATTPLAPLRGHETILLVEDEPAVREFAALGLRELGYTVLEAASAEEALRLVEQRNGEGIHLLLTDVVLPQLSGKQLAECIRAAHPDTKILFASGYTADAISARGVSDEGVAFLQKPFTMTALAAKIREVLGS